MPNDLVTLKWSQYSQTEARLPTTSTTRNWCRSLPVCLAQATALADVDMDIKVVREATRHRPVRVHHNGGGAWSAKGIGDRCRSWFRSCGSLPRSEILTHSKNNASIYLFDHWDRDGRVNADTWMHTPGVNMKLHWGIFGGSPTSSIVPISGDTAKLEGRDAMLPPLGRRSGSKDA